MITNKDIRVENGSLIINGDPYPLDGQSPEAIMQIVEDNSDTTPTENSDAPITSGGVFTALAGKEDTLTFDNAPTANSTNPVESGGVFTAIGHVASGIVNISKKDLTASTEDDFMALAFADIKADSNANNNASINRLYGWIGVDQYIIQAYRMSSKWIYAFVLSYDRAYIIEYNCNDDTIAVKKTFTLT